MLRTYIYAGLPGFAAYFKAASEEERGHAELLMTFQVCTELNHRRKPCI